MVSLIYLEMYIAKSWSYKEDNYSGSASFCLRNCSRMRRTSAAPSSECFSDGSEGYENLNYHH